MHTTWAQFGFAGLVTGTLFFIVWRILIWTMAWIDKKDIQYAEERKCWQEQLAIITRRLEEHSSQAREFHTSIVDAHKYQRSEHEKMISNLDEQYKVLLRINGEKH